MTQAAAAVLAGHGLWAGSEGSSAGGRGGGGGEGLKSSCMSAAAAMVPLVLIEGDPVDLSVWVSSDDLTIHLSTQTPLK